MARTRLRAQDSASVLLVMRRCALRESILLALGRGNLIARTADHVREAVAACETCQPQLLVVDLDQAGDAYRELLGRSTLPAIGLTARRDIKTKLAAFAAGADDIITVPCAPEEIVARAWAVLRRTYRNLIAPPLKVGDLEIDPRDTQVLRAGINRIRLTALEHALIYLLAANAGLVLSREAILDSLWGPAYAPDSNVVDRHIHSLRSKLRLAVGGTAQLARRGDVIETVHGHGYRLVRLAAGKAPPDEAEPPVPSG